MMNIDDYARAKLAQLDAQGLRRAMPTTGRESLTGASRGGRDLVSFCCNDYLNLSHHPDVIAAANYATEKYGAGAGGSRLISGNVPLYEYLESALAAMKGTEAAIVFGSGYLTSIGVIPCFTGPGDLILADALNHACLHAGARLSGATVLAYPHSDMETARNLLTEHRASHPHCMIITDGVFSMDGDLAKLDELETLAGEFDAWLLVDDAHGLGVVGAGRGSIFTRYPPYDVPLQMGTLSKAVGAYGGFLCATQAIVEMVRNRARSFVYSTGLPPGTIAAAIAALDIINTEPDLCLRPLQHAARFCAALNLPAPESPIVPMILGEAGKVMDASKLLEDKGFLVSGIRPPTVPDGTARLRFTFTAEHSDAEIDGLIDASRELLP